MYKGYVFACGSASLKSCVKNKRYACSEGQVDASEGIETGAVVFLHILESDRLVGPFTVTDKPRTVAHHSVPLAAARPEKDANSLAVTTLMSGIRMHYRTSAALCNQPPPMGSEILVS